MGFTLPSPTSPAEQARTLMTRKDEIEAEIEAQLSILKANSSSLHSPLVDAEGFPRADIDVYAVRAARVRIIELRNDLDAVMGAIGKALEGVYDPTAGEVPPSASDSAAGTSVPDGLPQPFAKVDGVAPSSPAAEAGLQREDLVVKFGHLTHQSFTSTSLQPLADLVTANENRHLPIKIIRSEQTVFLNLTPRKGWGGRGMLGCHIVPYSPP